MRSLKFCVVFGTRLSNSLILMVPWVVCIVTMESAMCLLRLRGLVLLDLLCLASLQFLHRTAHILHATLVRHQDGILRDDYDQVAHAQQRHGGVIASGVVVHDGVVHI